MKAIKIITTSMLCVWCMYGVAFGDDDLAMQIQAAQSACSGISNAMSDLKKMAGINTAITAVGTVAGGVALGTGIAKKNVDKNISSLERELAELEKLQKGNSDTLRISTDNIVMINSEIDSYAQTIANRRAEIDEKTQKSKTLGNVRTGTLAVSTATNVAGAVIAATNKVDGDLESKIKNCISAVRVLSDAKLKAKVESSATQEQMARAEKIISNCRDWEFVDLNSVNKRAKGAAISSGVGVGTGVVGTITSAVANTDETRRGDEQKEKNLNTTANVMAGASTVASAVATVFNATQISAIKKAVVVADSCEEALR